MTMVPVKGPKCPFNAILDPKKLYEKYILSYTTLASLDCTLVLGRKASVELFCMKRVTFGFRSDCLKSTKSNTFPYVIYY